jgi:hypothetical protein
MGKAKLLFAFLASLPKRRRVMPNFKQPLSISSVSICMYRTVYSIVSNREKAEVGSKLRRLLGSDQVKLVERALVKRRSSPQAPNCDYENDLLDCQLKQMAHALQSAGAIRGASTVRDRPGRQRRATNGGEERLVEPFLRRWHCSSFGFLSMNVVYTLDAVNTGVGFPHLER